MYGQFQNPIASAAKWIFFGFIIVIVMGILLGGNFKDATWLNPNIAKAQAERIEIDTAHEKAMNEFNERLTAAQTDAEIQQIQREQKLLDAQYIYNIQALNQDLVHQDIAFRTWMNVLTIAASAIAIALFVSTIIWIGSRAWVYIQSNSQKENAMAKKPPLTTKWIPNLPERESYDPWSDPEYRRQQIAAARDEEQKERDENKAIATRIRGISNAEQVSKNEYNNLPLAGD